MSLEILIAICCIALFLASFAAGLLFVFLFCRRAGKSRKGRYEFSSPAAVPKSDVPEAPREGSLVDGGSALSWKKEKE